VWWGIGGVEAGVGGRVVTEKYLWGERGDQKKQLFRSLPSLGRFPFSASLDSPHGSQKKKSLIKNLKIRPRNIPWGKKKLKGRAAWPLFFSDKARTKSPENHHWEDKAPLVNETRQSVILLWWSGGGPG